MQQFRALNVSVISSSAETVVPSFIPLMTINQSGQKSIKVPVHLEVPLHQYKLCCCMLHLLSQQFRAPNVSTMAMNQPYQESIKVPVLHLEVPLACGLIMLTLDQCDHRCCRTRIACLYVYVCVHGSWHAYLI